jgi:ParB-like chromosome segregation protein Spo0J
MSLKLPIDFAKKIADTLTVKAEVVEQLFDIEERKDGFFYAVLKPKQFLDKFQFRAMCRLVKDLGGQDYLQGAKAWAVPGPFAKKGGVTPQGSALPAGIKAVGQSNAQTSTPPSAPPFTPLQKAEKGPNDLDEEIVESLKGSSKKVGTLYPILVDSFGNTIDGFHRRKANPNWPTLKVDYVSDPLQLAKARLIANERRNVPAEEKRTLLDQIAKMTGWTPKQIAEDLGWSETTVYRYLSSELKKPEPKQLAEARAASSTLELGMDKTVSSATLKSQDMTVGKAKELLDTPAGKEVLEDAVKERLAEGAGEQMRIEEQEKEMERLRSVGEGPGSEVSESEDEPLYADSIKWKPDSSESTPNTHEPDKESIPSPKAKLKNEGIDTGFEWTCPECHWIYKLIHITNADGSLKHRFDVTKHAAVPKETEKDES